MGKPRFLLDANICIYILDRAVSEAVSRLRKCEVGEAVTSSIAYAEVMLGAVQRDGHDRAKRFFGLLPVLQFDQAAADIYARLPFKRQSFDRLIAAQAISLGLTVVTSNLRDFADVPGLKVEDWAARPGGLS